MYSRIFCFSLLYFTCVKDWKCLVDVESINVNVSEQKLFMPHEEKHTNCKYITNQTKTRLYSHIISMSVVASLFLTENFGVNYLMQIYCCAKKQKAQAFVSGYDVVTLNVG